MDEQVAGETDVMVFENRRALPRAWLVDTVTPMPEPDAIRTVKSSRFPDGTSFDARHGALVDPALVPPRLTFSPGATAVSVGRIGDGDIGVRVTSTGGGFLVLSENAYPGWHARIDGSEAPIYRADVTLQGVVVPAGTHRIDFTMESRSLRWGLITSGIGASICVALFVAGLARADRSERPHRTEKV
jgi:hypothetical protein